MFDYINQIACSGRLFLLW